MRFVLALSAVAATLMVCAPATQAYDAPPVSVASPDAPPVAPATSMSASQTVAEPRSEASLAAPASGPSGTPLAPVLPEAKPATPVLIARVNLSTQRMDVLVAGEARHNWAISSGRAGYATPRGSFRVQWTAKMWYSRKYDMAPMPHSVFFKDGFAIHGTSAVGLLGRPASHGCIRLAPANAAQFYALVHKYGVQNTHIQVFGTSPADRMVARQGRRDHTLDQAVARPPRPNPASGRGAVPNGYFAPGSPYFGRPSFVHDGIIYVKLR
jgi:lipoprotein-anchoring transpeptidase ErfK/SrfK